MRFNFTSIVLIFISLFAFESIHAASFNAVVSGNWSSNLTWGTGSGVIPGSSDDVTVQGGLTVTIDISNAVASALQIGFNGANHGNGTVSFNSGSSLTVSGTVTFACACADNGTVTMTNGGTFTCGSWAIGHTGNTFTPGTGTVIFTSTGTLPNEAALNTFNNLEVNSGTLTLGVACTVNTTLTVNSGAILATGGFAISAAAVTLNNAGGGGGATISGTGTVTLGGNVTVSYTGTGSCTGSTISCPLALTNSTTRTFTINEDGTSNNDLTISGIISTSGGLTLAGGGTLVLSALNTYTGATTITSGTCSINTINTIASDATTGSSLGAPTTIANGTITLGASGILEYTGTGGSSPGGTSDRVITLAASGGTINASGSGALTLSGGITGNTFNLVLTGTGSATESGVIATTTGSLTQNGSGTWTFSGVNTYTGMTAINSGTLAAGIATQAFGVGSDLTVASGATLSISGFSNTIGSLAGAGSVTLGAATLTFGDATSPTFSGIISGSGGITMNGTGGQTLTGLSTFSGITTVTAGTLSFNTINTIAVDATTGSALGAPTTAANGKIGVGASGILQYTGTGSTSDRVINLAVATGGTVDASGTGTLILTGGVTTSSGGSFNLTLTGTGTASESGTFATGGAATAVGTVIKNGIGSWTLTASNGSKLATTLNSGLLNINSAHALGLLTTCTFTIAGGTIDNTSGSSITVTNYPMTINSNFTFTGTNALNLGTGTVTLGTSPTLTVSASTLTMGGTINDNAHSLTVSGSGTLAFGSQSVTISALTISAGATLSSTSGTLSLVGNYSNSGTFTGGSGTVTFAGTAATQSIGGSASTTFNKLTIDNTFGTAPQVTLNTAASVNSVLTLTSGLVQLGTNNLSINSGGSISGGSAGSYIVTNTTSGVLTMNSIGPSTSITFPIGPNTTAFNPLILTSASGAGAVNYSAFIFASVNHTGTSGAQGELTKNAVNDTWNVSASPAISGTASLTLQWNTADAMTGFNTASAILSHFTGGAWDVPATGTVNTPSAGIFTMQRTGITSFSPFGVQNSSDPLPIELLSFTAEPVNSNVNLNWRTATETNNDFYTIERSLDDQVFDTVCIVKGAGNSSSVLNYSAEDLNPLNGTSYYRLKQTDFDGKYTYSQLVPVFRNAADKIEYQLFPNPVTFGQNSQLKINSPDVGSVLLVVRDISGKEIYANVVILQKNVNSFVAVDPEKKLSPGLYMVVATSDNTIFKEKLIVK